MLTESRDLFIDPHLTWVSRGMVGAAGGQARLVVAPLQGWESQRPGFGKQTASGSHCCGWEGQVEAKCLLRYSRQRPLLSAPASLSVMPPCPAQSWSLPLSLAVRLGLLRSQWQQCQAATWRSCTWTPPEDGWCQSSLGGQWCNRRRRRLRRSGCWPETQEERLVTFMDFSTMRTDTSAQNLPRTAESGLYWLHYSDVKIVCLNLCLWSGWLKAKL